MRFARNAIRATLMERYGPHKNMVDLRLELAEGCPKIAANQIMDLCGAFTIPTASGDERYEGGQRAGRGRRHAGGK